MNTSEPVPRTSISLIPPYHPGKRVTGAVKLSSNENPLGCSARVPAAIQGMMNELEVYPDGRGAQLVHQLSDLHGVAPERIVLGNGSDDIMIMAAATFIEPGFNAVMAATTFSQYAFATRLFGGEIRQVPLAEGSHDLPAMLDAIDEKTKIVWVCNPNNPTGTYRSHTEIRGFLDAVPSHVLVVLDEAYSEYADAEDFPNSTKLLNDYPNLLVLHTFSKIYGLAALRLGYGFSSPQIIENFLRVKQPFNVNSLALAAGSVSLEDTNFVERSLQVNREGMQYLTGELERLGLDYYPSQANFVCIHTPIPAQEAYETILRYGITVRSLQSFGMMHAIRVSIGDTSALQSLVQGLSAICHQAAVK
ncbi:MAG: histidinol-phosphate transaminase [Spirochaeta sp.]